MAAIRPSGAIYPYGKTVNHGHRARIPENARPCTPVRASRAAGAGRARD